MPDEFQCDVLLSHSAKDRAVVRPLAERLRQDGVKQIHKAEGKRLKDEIQLLPSSFLLHPLPRAPLNKERRFLPLRLDDAPSRARRIH